MLLCDLNFITDSAVRLKDALVHFDNPSSVSAAMDMAIRIDNRLFERRQEQRLFIRDIHPVILQQLLSLLTSGINSSNQDFLKPDDLQLQVSTAPSSIYLLLDQLQNQTIIWISTLCAEAHCL
ncbi:hypothetical protein BASA62_009819, partial [Batrachochytrium salamandrivorans]